MSGARSSPSVRTLVYLVLFVAAVYLGRETRPVDTQVGLVWPAAGIGVLWLNGAVDRRWAAVDAVLLGTSTVVVNLLTGGQLLPSSLFGPVNLAHAVVGVLLIRRLWPEGARMREPADVYRSLTVAVGATAVSAPGSALVAWLLLGNDPRSAVELFGLRNGGTTFAVLVVVLGLSAPHSVRDVFSRRRGLEALLSGAAAAAFFVAVFVLTDGLPVVFVALVLPVWIGLRLGIPRTAAGGAVMASAAVWLTVADHGALARVEPATTRAVLVQLFVVLLLLIGMVLATLQRARSDAADQLRASEARLRDTIDSAMVGGALLDLDDVDDRLWRLRQPNPALQALLRSFDGDIDWWGHVCPEDRERLQGVLAGLRAGRDRSWRGEVRHCLSGGVELWGEVHLSMLTTAPGRTPTAVVQFLDITTRKDMEQRLSHLALHDHLTGLPNRLLLLDRIEQELAAAARTSSIVALVFLDLDHFKTINDSLGHDVGDSVLRVTADRLRACMRAGDTVARIGGDEFVVCCGRVDDEYAALALAQRLTDVISPPIHLGDRTLTVGVSAGVTVSRPGDGAGTLLRQSDAAMYAAKRTGRGRVAPFDDELHARASRQLALAEDLARAVVEDHFVVHYQPVVDLRSRDVVALEALVRWDDPVRGLVPPAGWLDVVEDSELMVELGELVLRRACLDGADLAARFRPVRVHVNVSGRQLAQPGLVEQVARSLEDSGLPAELLVLELTETYLMSTHSSLLTELERLRGTGVKLSVDDFGTGYSSLSQLVQLPVDSLKIDRAFVSGIPGDSRSVAVVRGIVAMARSLGLDVVAEGVQSEEQADLLRTWSCPSAQGHLWSPALPLDQIGPLLQARPVRTIDLDARSVHDTGTEVGHVGDASTTRVSGTEVT